MPTCECPSPPGGRASCPDGHLAGCIIVDGRTVTLCTPVDALFRKPDPMVALYEHVAGELNRLGHSLPATIDAAVFARMVEDLLVSSADGAPMLALASADGRLRINLDLSAMGMLA